MTTDAGPAKFRTEENVWIPMPDGRQLAARIWFPETEEPAPAILEYLPYRKRLGTDPRDATTYPIFAGAGYVGVRVDISGTGESDGLLDDEYSEDELSNGCHVIEWIARQPWCSGAVGMIGISWGGFNGLQIAMRRPLALKAVVSVCATADRYADDIHYMGGCLLTDNLTWAAQMTAILLPPPSPDFRNDWQNRWLARLSGMPQFMKDWLGHQRRDSYWKHGSLCEDWNAPTAAILQIGGWNDAYRNTAAMVAEHYKGPHAALMGPWDHKYPHIARVGQPGDFHGEVIRWFDAWLKGEASGAAELPAYRAHLSTFTTESALGPREGYWVSEAEWPSPGIHMTSWGLRPGQLLRSAPGEGETLLSTTPLVGAASGNFCPGMRIENELPGDQAAADRLSLCFDGPALSEDLELLGQPVIRLRLRSDQPVAQVVARLCEVTPEGRSMLLSYRPFNLTHRNSHESPEVLPVGDYVTVEFPLNQLGHRLSKGNHLRLSLSTGYWPLIWPGPAPVALDLDLSAAEIRLPERRGKADPAAMAQARAFPRRASKTLAPSSGNVRRETLEDGTEVFETWDDFGRECDVETGVITHYTVRQEFCLNPARQESPHLRVHWEKEMTFGETTLRMQTVHELTSDHSDFTVGAEIRAEMNGAEVFADHWSSRIARDHM